MIGSLRGTVLERRASEILLEVAGVGYRVQLAGSALSPASFGGGELFLFVHQHIREDHQSLYGFLTAAERDCFESLISAHGVGPSLAMGVLSVHKPDQLVQILAEGDVAALCLVPGVGKKTAVRLLVELRAKLDVDTFLAGSIGGGALPTGGDSVAWDSPPMVVRQALGELGYNAEEIRTALDALTPDHDVAALDEASLLRLALLRLAGGR